MSNLHLSQVSFFEPIIRELSRRGADIDRLIHQSNLNKFDLSDPKHYVPSHYVYKLFDAICYQQGSHDILDDFAKVLEVTSLAQFGELVAYAPDALSALIQAEKYVSTVNTYERAGFYIRGNKATYWQAFIDDPVQAGRDQAEHITLAFAIHAFKIPGGNDWAPLEIHLQSKIAPNLDVLLPSGCDTRVYLGQSATKVVFETGLLSAPMLPKDGLHQLMPELPQISSLTARMEKILISQLPGNIPGLDRFAQMMDISPRTLQRRLHEEGKTLSEVIEQWRMKASFNLLQTTELKVKEISARLSYSNASNFERAFRRWTQTTPKRYRDLL